MASIAGDMGPQAPSGFNNTQHNCNSRRPRKRNCGRYTLIGAVKDGYVHHRFRCKSYTCGRCGPRKIRQVRKRIAARAVEHGLQRFLTLTLDPKKLRAEWGVREKVVFLYGIWRKMRVYLQRKLKRSLAFIAVVELQGNGNPHLHLLIGSYLRKEWISRAWQALGGGWSTRIEYADVHRISAYLAKYVTDDSLRDLPAGTRRFSTSRGLALFERSGGKGGWILVRAPIEYWRMHAVGVAVEEFQTEEDGARALASFVALQVPECLADRLNQRIPIKLWIEVRSRSRQRES